MNKKIMRFMIKIAIWIPVILMAITIFGFSKQNGTESSGLSEKVAVYVIDIADHVGVIHVDDSNRTIYIEKLQTPIRKGAHMSEYAVFGILVFIALTVDGVRFKLRYCITIAGVFLFACTDEFHQLFVPGRSGKFTDVLIDTCGCLIAMVVIQFIHHAVLRKKSKNQKGLA